MKIKIIKTILAGLMLPVMMLGVFALPDIASAATSVPTITTPANGATVTSAAFVKVDWSDSTGGTAPYEYQYESYSNASYTSLLYSSGWLSASEISTVGTPEGDYYLRVRARDSTLAETAWSNGAGNTYKVTVDNTPANAAPVLASITSPVTIPELSPFSFDANATDADGDTLTFSLSGNPSGSSINSSTGVFAWTPSEAQGAGDYTFTVMVSDGNLSDSQSVTIHVTEVADANVAPVLSSITTPVTIPELSAFSFDANATDANGDTLTFSLSSNPSGSSINSSTGVFSWTPSEAQGPGDYTFNVMVSDGSLSDSQSVTIHVTEVADDNDDLTTPMITSPANGATVTSAALVKVDWTNATGGTAPYQYQYQAFSNAAYTNSVYASGWLNASEIPTPGTPEGTYYLRVRAKDDDGTMSNWSNGAGNVYKIIVDNDSSNNADHPQTKNDCKKGGWMNYGNPSFKNQGQCEKYVKNHQNNNNSGQTVNLGGGVTVSLETYLAALRFFFSHYYSLALND
jgi:hypothetical protein